jgi:WG containing repeat
MRYSRLKTAIPTVSLLLVIAVNSAAQGAPPQSPKQPTGQGNSVPENPSNVRKSGPTGTPCLFDFERGEVPNCVCERATGEPFIAPLLLKELPFDGEGLAAVLSPKKGWMYVSRTGRVVISGVPWMDNGADAFHDGLVRVVKNEKYGFANRKGQLVIPPIYDGALTFQNGHATVCKGCADTCAERECEHHFFKGGEWFQIDTKGNVLARLHPKE